MVTILDDLRWDRVNEMTGGAANVCYQCGECSAVCPIEEYTGDHLDIRKMIRSAQLGTGDNDDLWACAACKRCEETCPRGVDIVEVALGLRSLALEDNRVPGNINKVLWDIYENGNPWGGNRKERAKWADNVDIKNAKEGVEVLLFVGCEAAYDKRMHDSIRSIVSILKAANVDFGFLGNDELCCGEPLANAGESGYLEELAEKNMQLFNDTKATVVVTVSPHCSATFNDIYRKFSFNTRVVHYSEFLHELFRAGKLHIRGKMDAKLTYHDPCILSRTDGFIEGPRELLGGISGVDLQEMRYAKEGSLCCGGGGNRMFLEFKAPRLADVRTKQAAETGADILITACPSCNMNLSDSARTQNMKLQVKDLAEVLKEVVT